MLNRFLNVKASLVGAFSVIVKLHEGSFAALVQAQAQARAAAAGEDGGHAGGEVPRPQLRHQAIQLRR